MTETLILSVVGVVLVALLADFCFRFLLPWWRMRRRLDRAAAVFRKQYAEAGADGHVRDLRRIEQDLAFDEDLVHLWGEFRDTLHAERSDAVVDDSGQPVVVRYRQTAPAEMYFSTRALIDVPLRTDFFKHLPGIFTGIGIIGTFAGLLTGLAQFQIRGDADRVNQSVETLVGSVRDAFYASAAAISLSIVVTLAEKRATSALHRRVQRLQHEIDRMFDSGAGEDYLSDIAQQGEATAKHLAHLKEGLVNDLKALLEEFADRQEQSSMAAAALVGKHVSETLEAPLGAMQQTMERSLEDQQQVVHRLMDESLNAFAERLEHLVGAKLTDAAAHVEAAAGVMHDAIGEVPGQVDAAVAALRSALADAPAQIEEAVARVRDVLLDIARSAEPIAANAERIAAAADRLAATVDQSTETLDYAIARFRSLGEELGRSMDLSRDMAQSLAAGAEGSQAAAEALAETSSRLERAQAELNDTLRELSGVAERVRTDEATHQELAEAVRSAALELSRAQQDVRAFLDQLSDALVETHGTFSREVNATLDRTHEAFHHNLALATQQLAGTVNDFGEFLETDFRGSVDGLHREMTRLGAPPKYNGAS